MKTQKAIYYAVAFFFACYATYCKEPMFGAFIVVALTNFLFEDKTRKNGAHTFFNYALIANAAVYLLQWYFLVYKSSKVFYGLDTLNCSIWSEIDMALSSERLLIVIFLSSFIRAYCVLFKKDNSRLHLDGLLFSSAAYATAFIILRFHAEYYFVPSVLLAIPSFAYWTCKGVESQKTSLTIFALTIVLLSTINDFSRSLHWINSIREKRAGDMKTVKKLSELIKLGTPIYLYKNTNVCYGSYMRDVWNAFLNFSLRDDIFIQKIDNVNSLPDRGIIMYPTSNVKDVDIFSELAKKGFKLWDRKTMTNIYMNSASLVH
jgi:hypothetical protein